MISGNSCVQFDFLHYDYQVKFNKLFYNCLKGQCHEIFNSLLFINQCILVPRELSRGGIHLCYGQLYLGVNANLIVYTLRLAFANANPNTMYCVLIHL